MEIDYEKIGGKNVLVTGGLGFIGSNLAHKLVELGSKVSIADSLVSGLGGKLENIKDIEKDVKLFLGGKGDIGKNSVEIKELISNTDYIFNCAGSIKHTNHLIENFEFDTKVNLYSQAVFMELCREVMVENKDKKLGIIYTGTRDQYGKLKLADLPVKEDKTMRQITDYQSISKEAAEKHHFMLHQTLKNSQIDGIKVISARLTNTYGPRQDLKCGAVVPTYILKSLSGENLEIWGGGEALRDFNYVDDVVDGLIGLAISPKSGGEAYNLGCSIGKEGMKSPIGNNLCTIKDLAYLVAKFSDNSKILNREYPQERKHIEPGHCCSDITKIYKTIGWTPKVSLEEGIKNTIEFYKNEQSSYLE